MLSVALWTVGRTLVVIDRTVSAIGSSRPIWSVLLPRLCSSAASAKPSDASRPGRAREEHAANSTSPTRPAYLSDRARTLILAVRIEVVSRPTLGRPAPGQASRLAQSGTARAVVAMPRSSRGVEPSG